MKVILDTCVWGGVRQALSAAGHDVIWAGDWDEDPGDDEILAKAYREGRVLVTLDKDFGTLAFLHGRPHAGNPAACQPYYSATDHRVPQRTPAAQRNAPGRRRCDR